MYELASKTIHSVYRTLVAGGRRTEFLTSSLAVGWWWFSAAKISLCSFASNPPFSILKTAMAAQPLSCFESLSPSLPSQLSSAPSSPASL